MTHVLDLDWSRSLARRAHRGGPQASAAARAARASGGDEDEWVTVYTANGAEEAEVIRGALEAVGIPAFIRDRAMSTIFGNAVPWAVHVQVPRSFEARARERIAE